MAVWQQYLILKHNEWATCVINVNFLYNSCSIALVVKEDLLMYLRCLISIELHEHDYYCNHPLIKEQHDKGAFVSLNYAFSMCLNTVALTVIENQGYTGDTAAIVAEARSKAINHEYSYMM